MRTLVILMGRCNVGKTTTLRKLQRLLEDNGFKFHKRSRSNCPCLIRNSESVVIGMNGDDEGNIQGNFRVFEKHKATVCITATRTFGLCSEVALQDELSKCAKDFKQIVYIIKRGVAKDKQEYANQHMAEKIYEGVKTVLDGRKFAIRDVQRATVITEL